MTQSIPLKICYVRDESDKGFPADFFAIREFCEKNSLNFYSRQYNSQRYYEDCNHILSLPAYHIYRGRIYHDTFYGEKEPIRKILDAMEEWRKEEEAKRLREAARRERWSRFIGFFLRRRRGLSAASPQ